MEKCVQRHFPRKDTPRRCNHTGKMINFKDEKCGTGCLLPSDADVSESSTPINSRSPEGARISSGSEWPDIQSPTPGPVASLCAPATRPLFPPDGSMGIVQ